MGKEAGRCEGRDRVKKPHPLESLKQYTCIGGQELRMPTPSKGINTGVGAGWLPSGLFDSWCVLAIMTDLCLNDSLLSPEIISQRFKNILMQ